MPKPVHAVSAALLKKGFQARSSHHTFYHLYVDGKKTLVFTKISHGEREISDSLLKLMARQLRLSRAEFIRLIECPLSAQEYLRLLHERKCL